MSATTPTRDGAARTGRGRSGRARSGRDRPGRPSTVRLTLHHARANVVELFRQPGYWVPSVALPTLFFLFFGITGARQLVADVPAASGLGGEVVLTPFLLFGLLAIAFFQFGVGIAEERRLPWERALKALPLPPVARLGGRVLTALVFSALSIVTVTVVALLTVELRLTAGEWALWLTAVFLGAVPFGLMGHALGYATTPKAALPIANIAFLVLSFAGGLFVPPEQLPAIVEAAAPWTPTNHYLRFALGAIGGNDAYGLPAGWVAPALYLLGWTVLFAALAVLAYRRDEGVRYR